jgi:hypothetical protein
MNVFISYRRKDTQDFVGRLADRLRAARGIGKVFMDIDAIGPGENFRQLTHAEMLRCDVSLIVIGPAWRGESADGGSRIFDERDLVRREVRDALSREGRVIPVLVNDAAMPKASDLPDDLRRLPELNAVPIRHAAFERDVDYLLDGILERRRPGRVGAFLRRHPIADAVLRSVLSACLGLLALIAALAVIKAMTPNAPENLKRLTGSDEAAALFTIFVVLGSAALPLLLRRLRVRR